MITQINNRLHRLTNRRGQHTAEFLIMFLAVSLVFIGMRVYLRRGVDAKLKHVEMQLNDAIVGERLNIEPVPNKITVQVFLSRVLVENKEVKLKSNFIETWKQEGSGHCPEMLYMPNYDCYSDFEGKSINPASMNAFYIRGIYPKQELASGVYRLDFRVGGAGGWRQIQLVLVK